MTINVERRVGFSKTSALRLAEGGVKVNMIFGHTRQNVIASAVENTAQALNVVANQAAPQSANNEMPPQTLASNPSRTF